MNRLQRQAVIAFGAALLAGTIVVAALVLSWPGLFGQSAALLYGDPYNLAGRPLPLAEASADEVLPARVGAFRRGPVEALTGEGGTAGGVEAVYESGQERVVVRALRTESAAVARLVVSTNVVRPHTAGVAEVRTVRAGEEPAFVRVRFDDGAAHIYWQRQTFVFYAASGSAATLDAFMAAFPY